MIKINLATRKQAALSSGTKGGRNIEVDVGGLIRDPVIRRTALALIVAVIGSVILDDQTQQLMDAANAKAETLNAETVRLTADAAKLQEYEALKKQLEEDELIIRTKLNVLTKLAAERGAPPKLLTALSEAMPEDAWISALKILDNDVTIAGGSADFNRISDLIQRLGESTYFQDVMLTDSEQKLDRGVNVAFFNLSAKRRK
ncbi:MAG: hypothetical protein A2X94_15055 [Bdellovibrionales bacterium GWB1_55_8]|nr:MAG: hypothetical protein A2X94_15055 [Bdellovibrionales bacterium GWB1_55_8]